ncbi:DUF4238 domain-containing protein [Fibrivirga algicola]|uniref:DUF4238 domain-containing protein n=1 Tax=Fibrivirga algicola TaxID=2950420 RepID=A0ABX0QFI2_9BACT|nr:DUF4238 domain-containing protein [Fibrivirga algicola]NID10643.1 DUF4238 domain-containing protein [Fibrivirga algicola]
MSKQYVNHHYVPQVYIRRFCVNMQGQEKVWAFDRNMLVRDTPTTFRSYAPKQICHEEHLYKFRNDAVTSMYGINDKNIVEKESFKGYENDMRRIIDSVDQQTVVINERFVPIDDARILIKTLLNMKKRNPYMVNDDKTNQETVRRTNDLLIKDLEENREVWEARLATEGRKLDDAISQMMEIMAKEGFSEDMHRLSLYLEGIGSEDVIVPQLADFLLKKKWSIQETSITNLFITSDNPGFSINKELELFNVNFIEDSMFIFPLSPYRTLYINTSQDDVDSDLEVDKRVTYSQAGDELVQTVNRCTLGNCNQFIYSSSQIALVNTIRNWKDLFGSDPCFPK